MTRSCQIRRSRLEKDTLKTLLSLSHDMFLERQAGPLLNIYAVYRLPFHHRDPFDRILVAQAVTEPAHLFTVNGKLARYSEMVTMIGKSRR